MKKFFEKISKGTVFRTLAGILSILNMFISITNEDVPMWYTAVSAVILIAACVALWWYNNDITDAAIVGTKITYALKDGKLTPEEAEALLKEAENAGVQQTLDLDKKDEEK